MIVGAKLLAGLGLALALSLGGNALQLFRAGVASGEAKNTSKLEQLQRENAGLAKAHAINETLAGQRNIERTEILGELELIAERARPVKFVYREAAPLALGCAPGQGRMDAVNRGLAGEVSP
jgi:hypothetical protein